MATAKPKKPTISVQIDVPRSLHAKLKRLANKSNKKFRPFILEVIQRVSEEAEG